MRQLKFYVDFDDILAETANRICEISKDMFGTTAIFEHIKDFDLKKSLNISQEQYEELMDMTHDDRFDLTKKLQINGLALFTVSATVGSGCFTHAEMASNQKNRDNVLV